MIFTRPGGYEGNVAKSFYTANTTREVKQMTGYLTESNRTLLIDTCVNLIRRKSSGSIDGSEVRNRLAALPDPELENEVSCLIGTN